MYLFTPSIIAHKRPVLQFHTPVNLFFHAVARRRPATVSPFFVNQFGNISLPFNSKISNGNTNRVVSFKVVAVSTVKKFVIQMNQLAVLSFSLLQTTSSSPLPSASCYTEWNIFVKLERVIAWTYHISFPQIVFLFCQLYFPMQHHYHVRLEHYQIILH